MRSLKNGIESEKQFGNMFELERSKFEAERAKALELSEDLKAALIGKEGHGEEQREKNFIEKSLHKQRVKQAMFQKLDAYNSKRVSMQKKVKEVQDGHAVVEEELERDGHEMRRQAKEQSTSHAQYLFNMKYEMEQRATLLRDLYERKIYELQHKFKLANDKVVRDLEAKSAALTKMLEEKKKEKILEITGQNARRYKEIENYYLEISSSNLNFIKQMKIEIKKAQKSEDRDRRTLQAAKDEQNRLKSPLTQIRKDIEVLEKDKEHWLKVKAEKNVFRKKIDGLKVKFRELEYEYEVRFQQNTYLKQQLGKLEKGHQESLFQVHQKAGLRGLLLKKQYELSKRGKEAGLGK